MPENVPEFTIPTRKFLSLPHTHTHTHTHTCVA